jgi:hypothetical protein
MWDLPSCEGLLYSCCIGVVNLTFSSIYIYIYIYIYVCVCFTEMVRLFFTHIFRIYLIYIFNENVLLIMGNFYKNSKVVRVSQKNNLLPILNFVY